MKTKHISLNSKTMIACLLSGAILFASCKKDISSEELNPATSAMDPVSVISTDNDSTAVTATAVLATVPYEGFGANAVGGANSSTVYHVTNLSSSGAGSFANGIGSNKTILFDVSGTITGRFDLIGISYLTIYGNGQDITINNNNNGDGISFDGSNTHHCVLKGITVTGAGNDGINVLDGSHDIMITNCSSYGNTDGNIDVAGGVNVTVQYCILGSGKSGWAGDMLITATNVSAHHNLFSPATSGEVGERCPLVHSNYTTPGNPCADIRNNLIWKFGRSGGSGSGYGTAIAYNATANIINNYYYTTGTSAASATNTDDGYGGGATGKAYVAGNVSGNSGVNANGSNNHAIYTVPSVTTQDACTAASMVLAQAGPRPLNSTNQAFISAVTLPGCSGTTPPANQAPVVNAGAAQTITLPVSSVTLSGSATDADGTIASYLWTKSSGTGSTIASPNSASTIITGLTAGSYVFNLKATDNAGAVGNKTVTITVSSTTPPPTNQIPVVNAGAAQTITLPVSSVTLSGSATDADGTIASYLWTKSSGTGSTIASPNSASTIITGLTAGSYVFNLKATDNAGAVGNKTVTITVSSTTPPPTNQIPVVNAGAAQTITLPVSSVTLSGSATDADGTIASYLWTKASGTGGTITNPNSASTTVSGLTAGVYVFNLKATDNAATAGNKTVTIVVNAASTGGGYGTLSFSQGYDASSSVNTNLGTRNSVSFTNYLTGPGSFRSEVRAGDAGSSGMRSEMAYTATAQNPTEGVVEYDVYYQNWSSLDGGGHSIQWSAGTSGAGAILSLQNYNGKFDVVRAIGSTVTRQSGTLMTCSSNTWYKMRWEFKWSTGTDGYARLYH